MSMEDYISDIAGRVEGNSMERIRDTSSEPKDHRAYRESFL